MYTENIIAKIDTSVFKETASINIVNINKVNTGESDINTKA